MRPRMAGPIAVPPTWFQTSALRAWVNLTYPAGTPTSQDSYNVSSLGDNATGDVTVNWGVAFSSVNYVVLMNGQSTGPAGGIGSGTVLTGGTSNITASSARLMFGDNAHAANDVVMGMILAVGSP